MDIVTTANYEFTKELAKLVAEQLRPELPKLVKEAVRELVPQKGMTRAEASKMLRISEGDNLSAILDDPSFPSYPNGTQRRYWPRAVDEYMTTHNWR
ncbi:MULTISPECIES: hypothetical protein [Lacticaseibacillus]|uniref:DNA-binding protein n=2 Tax=Lacticaseibacillus TaxID=2759736 RepID=A0ABW4CKZ9_9LACO|nr:MULTISPECIES: hypothetical protein [Lacticaseibacillus]